VSGGWGLVSALASTLLSLAPHPFLAAAPLALPLLLAPAAQAQTVETLVRNTQNSISRSIVDEQRAIKFTTGSLPAILTEVRVRVSSFSSTAVVRIRAGNTTDPGNIIATLNNPDSAPDESLVTFTAPAGITLAASTSYFLSLNDGSTGSATFFEVTTGTSETGLSGWSISNHVRRRRRSSDPWSQRSQEIPLFEVRGQIIPAAPTGVTATAGDGQVTLNWSDPSNSAIDGYEFRSGTGTTVVWGSWTAIAGSDDETTSHTVTGLTNGAQHSFQIRAVDGTAMSAASNIATATPKATVDATISLDSDIYFENEVNAEVYVELSQAVSGSVEVYLTASGGTATKGADYAAGAATAPDGAIGAYKVTIPAGRIRATLAIATTDDAIVEADETFMVTISDIVQHRRHRARLPHHHRDHLGG